MGRVLKWREAEAETILGEVRAVIMAGGVAAIPTETFYALAAHPFREDALARLFALKERPPEKPVLLLVSSPEMVLEVAAAIPEAARRLMDHFWPGPLTIIFPARPRLSPWLTGDTGTIGVRLPAQELTRRLVAATGLPVTGTSANRTGKAPLTLAVEVEREFGAELDLVLEAGPCPGGAPSTVVDATRRPPRLVRPGALPAARLAAVLPQLESTWPDNR